MSRMKSSLPSDLKLTVSGEVGLVVGAVKLPPSLNDNAENFRGEPWRDEAAHLRIRNERSERHL